MNKFDKRIKSLVERTHNFISNEDYSLILEYFLARFDDEKKPDDFDEIMKEVERLEREFDPVKNPDGAARFRELIDSSLVVRLSNVIPFFEAERRKYPRGAWHPKWYSHGFSKLVRDAKAYLKFRNSKGDVELDS